MDQAIRYDYPLNERIRLLLRLEALFQQFAAGIGAGTHWSSRQALAALFDLLELVGRAEPKSEIVKELERQARVFDRLKERPDIDSDALDRVTREIRQAVVALSKTSPAELDELRQHVFLNAIRQRSSIPGGSCAFDLPELHHWLRLTSAEARTKQLERWLTPLAPLREGNRLILELLRGSAIPRRRVAENGRYQETLDGEPATQLLRLEIAAEQGVFPEISGDRHRFTIRFMVQDSPDDKPQPVDGDVTFRLACCAI